MSALRACLLGLLWGATAANAQSWPELDTLVFSPHRPVADLPLAVSVAGPVMLPEDPEPALVARVVRLTETIAENQRAHGQNAPELVDDLLALAEVHRQLGDHSEAIVTLERAQHIIRTDRGLYSLDQVPAVEAMIANIEPSKDYFRTMPLEAYLQELVLRNPQDPRSVTVQSGIADRRLEAAQHYLAHGIPPIVDISIGGVPDPFRSSSPPTARQLAWRHLRSARRNYGSALTAAIASGQFGISDLLGLEQRIVDTLYFEILHPDLAGGRFVRSLGTALGVYAMDVLDAKLENSRHFPGTPEAVASVMIEIADWRLLLGSHGAALDGYREARTYLLDSGAATETVDAMLSPEAPVFLPDFPARFAAAGAAGHVAGWFDVDVETTRYGRIRSFAISDRSGSATEAVEGRFRRHLSMYRFRPRFVGSEPADSDAFSLRFHFSYERLAD